MAAAFGTPTVSQALRSKLSALGFASQRTLPAPQHLSCPLSMKRLIVVAFAIIALLALIWFLEPGSQLIINHPEKSDAIVVLAGSETDSRYWRGLELLRAGYGNHLFLDVVSGVSYGHPLVDLARDFVARTAGTNAAQVSVCPVEGDSTKDEAPQASACLQQLQPKPHSVIVVTDDYHTRRALSIFRNRLRQYRWTAAAAKNDFLFGHPWWKEREWAKTYVTESEKLLWWELFDRWRK
jgi:uncharacterized SAM-binding protein YcdF (DUF218 family)